jgi:hypothetical protein
MREDLGEIKEPFKKRVRDYFVESVILSIYILDEWRRFSMIQKLGWSAGMALATPRILIGLGYLICEGRDIERDGF